MRYITKQAYINGLAARGILRNLLLNKQAEADNSKNTSENSQDDIEEQDIPDKLPTDVPDDVYQWNPGKDYYNNVAKFQQLTPDQQKKEREAQKQRYGYLSNSIAKPEFGYMTPGLATAGIGAAIGALIQAAREKNILAGAGIGAGIGGIAGLGGKYINDTYIYPEIEKAYNNSGAGPYLDIQDA